MSAGRYIMRGRVFQGRAFAPWALAGAGVTPPAAEGWMMRVAVRQFVPTSADRVSIPRPADRVWIARVDNE